MVSDKSVLEVRLPGGIVGFSEFSLRIGLVEGELVGGTVLSAIASKELLDSGDMEQVRCLLAGSTLSARVRRPDSDWQDAYIAAIGVPGTLGGPAETEEPDLFEQSGSWWIDDLYVGPLEVMIVIPSWNFGYALRPDLAREESDTGDE